jgi:calcineurin-like phosphoesterase family protein
MGCSSGWLTEHPKCGPEGMQGSASGGRENKPLVTPETWVRWHVGMPRGHRPLVAGSTPVVPRNLMVLSWFRLEGSAETTSMDRDILEAGEDPTAPPFRRIMVDIWFIGDPHFGHESCVSVFKRHDGSPLRDFNNGLHMTEHIVECVNSVVKPQDHLYLMGDIAMKRQFLPWVAKCNGHKRLLFGNHDIFDTNEYTKYFEKVMAYRVIDKIMFSHIPIHPDSLGRFDGNAHAHLHHQPKELGPRYRCLSAEMVNYTPVSLEQVKGMFSA